LHEPLHVLQEVPYVIMHNGKNYSGNSRFYGFCVDLLERVARDVGFDYILDLVPDKKYGARDAETGEWNGMVLQLMQHVSLLSFHFSFSFNVFPFRKNETDNARVVRFRCFTSDCSGTRIDTVRPTGSQV